MRNGVSQGHAGANSPMRKLGYVQVSQAQGGQTPVMREIPSHLWDLTVQYQDLDDLEAGGLA